MPDVNIKIGERNFSVTCQAGEEHFLESAAKMLDTEAATLLKQIGRIPEERMLLMSGLMLADKTAGLEDKVGALEEKLATQETLVAELRREIAEAPVPEPVEPERVEVAVIPEIVMDAMDALGKSAETLAQEAQEKVAGS